MGGTGPHRIVGRRRPLPRGDDSTGPPARQERVLIDVAMPGWDIPTGHLFGRSPRIRPTRTLAGTEVLRKPQDLTTGADLHLGPESQPAATRTADYSSVTRSCQCGCASRSPSPGPSAGGLPAPLGRRARGTPSESLARPAACPARTVRSNRAARSRRRAPRTRRSTEPCSGPRAAAHRGAPSWRRPAGGRRVSLPLVAHEQQRGVRVVDEVSQVPHHPAAGQHPVGGHDQVRPGRELDRAGLLGRVDDDLCRIVERRRAVAEQPRGLLVEVLAVAPVDPGRLGRHRRVEVERQRRDLAAFDEPVRSQTTSCVRPMANDGTSSTPPASATRRTVSARTGWPRPGARARGRRRSTRPARSRPRSGRSGPG